MDLRYYYRGVYGTLRKTTTALRQASRSSNRNSKPTLSREELLLNATGCPNRNGARDLVVCVRQKHDCQLPLHTVNTVHCEHCTLWTLSTNRNGYLRVTRQKITFPLKLSSCCECCVLSFAWYPDVWILYADVSEHCLFHLQGSCEQVTGPMKMEQTVFQNAGT
jgi:hypothetical protein